MSGLNVMDSSYVISFFFYTMIGGTIAYGDFFYDYKNGGLFHSITSRVSFAKFVIFFTIAICSFTVPCKFNQKINDNFVKFKV